MTDSPIILAEGLHKHYGEVHALDGLDLTAVKGSILAVLGPNGAGKTTAVRVLTTLLRPDKGRAEVAGYDVVHHAADVRAQIGVTGQSAAVDERLTGLENLEMFGRLNHLSGSTAKRRADELLERFELTEAAHRYASTYSGGMRRRLDVAISLIAKPPVLFLDEPTTGLDPRGRLAIWGLIRGLVAEGTTVLLTTQYLDEADQLADCIAVIDHGRVIAQGTGEELKNQIGGQRLELTVAGESDAKAAMEVLRGHAAGGEVRVGDDGRHFTVALAQDGRQLAVVVRDLDAAKIGLDDFALRRPTLDDVFLSLTGRVAAETDQHEAAMPKASAR
jgi:ABC-2 type transport system ATP-binding protein